jgi:hypothetical protein
MTKYIFAIAVNLFLFVPSASAHYLFLAIDSKAGEHGTMNLYFEEGPRPGDGFYLDPFIQRGQAWLRLAGAEKAEPLKLTEVKVEEKNQRWLSSELPKSGPRAVESYGKWGVYRYGKTDVLLHYYAKYVEVQSAEQLVDVGKSDNLKFDVRPSWQDGTLFLQVVWDGEPAVETTVYFRGPGLNQTVKTDKAGVASFKPEKPGQYVLRAYLQQSDLSGTFEDKEYQQVRHHSSLTMILPIGGK